MSKETTCCFTGHRSFRGDFPRKRLDYYIEKAIKKGVDTFISGAAIGFDSVAADAVLRAKKRHPNVKLHLYLPCRNQTAKWAFIRKIIHDRLISLADYIDMPDCDYYDGCMKKRNYKMVDDSSYCISYFDGSFISGTGQTVRYAEKCGLEIYNVYETKNHITYDKKEDFENDF